MIGGGRLVGLIGCDIDRVVWLGVDDSEVINERDLKNTRSREIETRVEVQELTRVTKNRGRMLTDRWKR